MISINYPPPDFKTKTEGNSELIFDAVRKKWLLLTPEEWVRQNFIQYLVQVMKYPAALIALEKQIKLGELIKRFDILVYDQQHQPWMIIECKAGDVLLKDEVLQQALRYNISVPVPYIIVTNGNFTYGWEKKNNTLSNIDELPAWK